MATEYVRDPAEIYRQSFASIEAEAELSRLPESIRPVAIRLIHACGMTDIVEDLAWSDKAVETGQAALKDGCAIFTDVEMVKAGIIGKFLPANNEVLCTLRDPRVPALASDLKNTRSAAAVDLWRNQLEGAVVVIGNAPTALFRLLELLDEGYPKPALILGFPVGFVGAVESKQALSDNPRGCQFMTLHGRRGGSAIASSVLNAIVGGLRDA